MYEQNEVYNKRENFKKDSKEINQLFIYLNQCLYENDSLQNICIFHQSSLKTNYVLYTDKSKETIIYNVNTQRYLEKLYFVYEYDQSLHYLRLLQFLNLNRQIYKDRRINSKIEQNDNSRLDIKSSPLLNYLINEDRLRRFRQQLRKLYIIVKEMIKNRQIEVITMMLVQFQNKFEIIYSQIYIYQLMGVDANLIENVRENGF
ncbi:unnamed protein product [Paramecium pentaurelia]|uniref:Uncharacterized protein n=1 Tax=Paramecium pentaurelia TaxID=43138 RepID=A0A8S1X642_9CILI|nr:unnamed protein product [Paramecium pentaurelia]